MVSQFQFVDNNDRLLECCIDVIVDGSQMMAIQDKKNKNGIDPVRKKNFKETSPIALLS